MARIIRVKYESGVLKPLGEVGLEEGEEVKVVIMDKSFYDLVEGLELEAKEDIDRVIAEVRKRGKHLYE